MISIVIQSGGASSRMGQEKAFLPFLGQPLIARVAGRLSVLTSDLLVVTHRPEAYAFLGLGVVADLFPGQGPLGGLITALTTAREETVGVFACDMPFLNVNLIRAQAERLEQSGADIVIPRLETGFEPLHAIYRRASCLPEAQRALAEGQRRMTAWWGNLKVVEMGEEELRRYDLDLLSFTNVNTPEEFARAEEIGRSGI